MGVRSDPSIVTFASGVLTPKLLARADIKQYGQGLRSAENMTVLPHGAITRRPGTYFVAETKASNFLCRLIPFQYSTEQTYMIEAGLHYFRFYANSGRLESPPGTPVELVTPWSDEEVWDLQFTQTADVMYLVHPNYAPRKLTRTSVTTFSLDTVAFSRARAPLLALNQNSDNYATVSGTWPNLTITMAEDTFVVGDVGRTFYIRSTIDKNAYYMTLVGFTSAKIMTATGIDRFSDTAGAPNGPDADRWAFGAFDATHGCRAVALHEGRLAYGGFTLAPDMIWVSVSDDYDNFELTSPDAATTDAENDDKAIQRRAVSGQVNSVNWLASGGTALLVGTSDAEFRLKPANDDILSPLSASLKRTTQRGVAALPPAVIDNDIYYIDRSRAVLRQLTFDLLEDAEKAKDVSIMAEHLLLPGVRQIVYQQAPNPTLWIVLNNGSFLGWSIETDQEVLAAHPHRMGGSSFGARAQVESIGVIPGANVSQNGALEDQLWFVTVREINGLGRRFIERGVPFFRPNLSIDASDLQFRTATDLAFFVDCGLTLNAPIAVTDISITTLATPATVTAPAHGLSDGNTVRFRGVAGDDAHPEMKDLFEQRRFTVSAATTDTFIPLSIITGLPIDTAGAQFLADCLVYKEVTTLSGLDHLEAEEVAILADGKIHPDKTVVGGAVSLDYPASIVHAGLPYVSKAQTMPLVGPSGRGTDQGYPKDLGQIAIAMMDTIGGEYGRGDTPSAWEPMVFGNASNLMDYGPRLFTGTRKLKFAGSASEDLPTVHMRQTQALPLTVLGLFPRAWGNAD